MPKSHDHERTVNLSSLRLNDHNPRTISKDAFTKLCASVKEFPKMMALRGIIADKDGIVIGGTQRYRACVANGMKEVPASWVKRAEDFTPDERRRFIIADNAPEGIGGQWDFDMLANEWEIPELIAAGFTDAELGAFNVGEADAPELKDGDRAPFRQATFTLHDEQWEEVEAAIAKAKEAGGGESAVNENSNGNALAWVCRAFNGGRNG